MVHVPYRNSMMTMGMSNILSHFQHMLFDKFLYFNPSQGLMGSNDDFMMYACAVLKDSLGGNCRTRMLATVGQWID